MSSELGPKDQLVLDRFASRHGRYWKVELEEMWQKSRYSDVHCDDIAALHSLRNSERFGPKGLDQYRPGVVNKGGEG